MKLIFRFRNRLAIADKTTLRKRMSPGTRNTTFAPLAIGIDGTTEPSSPWIKEIFINFTINNEIFTTEQKLSGIYYASPTWQARYNNNIPAMAVGTAAVVAAGSGWTIRELGNHARGMSQRHASLWWPGLKSPRSRVPHGTTAYIKDEIMSAVKNARWVYSLDRS